MSGTLQDSMYHRVLRVFAVVCALVLVFESGLISDSTSVVALNTRLYLANSVGASASVEPTELNTLTAELTSQKKQLEEREAALRQREIDIGLNGGATQPSQTATYVLSSILFVMLVLIVLNYVLDFIRAKEAEKKLTTQTV